MLHSNEKGPRRVWDVAQHRVNYSDSRSFEERRDEVRTDVCELPRRPLDSERRRSMPVMGTRIVLQP